MGKQFIVVICGPTASGKTTVSIELARKLGGEIISADSMQIYEGMDIATAKPAREDMRGVPHYLMDFYSPHDAFSVADYVRLARERIEDISSRDKIPFVVGGTGLYISALVDNIVFDESENDYDYREQLHELAEENGAEYIHAMLEKVDPQAAASIHPNNLSRVIRALEVYKMTGKTITEQKRLSKSEPSPYDPCMIAFDIDRNVLYDRINKRVDVMLAQGLIDEARDFYAHDDYPTAAQAIGYKELLPFFNGEKELIDCVESLKHETRKFAKRQMTWFKRDERIHWIKVDEKMSRADMIKAAEEYITAFRAEKE